MAVNLHDTRRADARGWGPGWPHCQTPKMVPLEVDVGYAKVSFPGGIRPEVHDLAEMLVIESVRRGFEHVHDPGCWGYGCRPIASTLDNPGPPGGPNGPVPSNHSWGLALDVDAPTNGYDASHHTIPEAMANLWNQYGWRWGGDYTTTKDWMHFEFMGTPADARDMTDKARRELGGTEVDVGYEDFARGIEHGLEGKEIGDHAPHDTVLGYRVARRASKQDPTPDAPASKEATGAHEQPSGHAGG